MRAITKEKLYYAYIELIPREYEDGCEFDRVESWFDTRSEAEEWINTFQFDTEDLMHFSRGDSGYVVTDRVYP